VAASEYGALQQIRELQRLLARRSSSKKTFEKEILRHALI